MSCITEIIITFSYLDDENESDNCRKIEEWLEVAKDVTKDDGIYFSGSFTRLTPELLGQERSPQPTYFGVINHWGYEQETGQLIDFLRSLHWEGKRYVQILLNNEESDGYKAIHVFPEALDKNNP